MNKRWVIATPDPADVECLTREMRLPRALAAVLVNRGFGDPADAHAFLNPKLRDLRDPFELPAMRVAVERIAAALTSGQRIVIYGDYDVDGVTSCALLTRVLRAAGGDVQAFLPQRLDEGYGLSHDGVTRCVEQHGPQLLIAVDCGTTAVAEIAVLREQGVDVIVLDHHEPPADLPACVALVNPKLAPPAAELAPFASVGVTFKLAHALAKELPALRDQVDLRDSLDLVAVGTVADLVPLTGENRLLVRAGLERLATTGCVGLRALKKVAGVAGAVRPYDVGFRLGPRLNAAGRLADARAALELLLTEDAQRAAELAELLDMHNAERQQIERRITEQALAQARSQAGDRVLVLADETWHPGVIGIVASRVVQQHYRPTVVIGEGGKGSCRSITGFSIVAALGACAGLLEKFGGHDMAAGLTVQSGRVADLRRELNAIANRQLTDEALTPALAVDSVVTLGEIDEPFVDALAQFEPCGIGNLTPCFVARGVRVRGTPRVLAEKHWRLQVADATGVRDAIWWGGAGQDLPERFDLAGVPEFNE